MLGSNVEGGGHVGVSHHITRYRDASDGSWYAESWIQVDLLRWCWCLSRRRTRIWAPPEGEARAV